MTLHIKLGKFDSEQDRRRAIRESFSKKYGHNGRRVVYSKLTIKGKLKKLFQIKREMYM